MTLPRVVVAAIVGLMGSTVGAPAAEAAPAEEAAAPAEEAAVADA